MKHYILAAVIAAGALASMAAQASEALAKAKNCMACHAANTKLVGPALKDIAAKYANDKNAEASLVLKVMKGSSGVWDPIPMPPNPQVSEAEARTLVRWMLGRK
ncbi:MAG: c-type cytochrome [Duganella sp.]